MFSTSERQHETEYGSTVTDRRGRDGKPPTPTHARRRKDVFWCSGGWAGNRAHLRDRDGVERGLKMKGWTCGSKPWNTHDDMLQLHYTTRPHTFVLLGKVKTSVTPVVCRTSQRATITSPLKWKSKTLPQIKLQWFKHVFFRHPWIGLKWPCMFSRLLLWGGPEVCPAAVSHACLGFLFLHRRLTVLDTKGWRGGRRGDKLLHEN